MNSGSSNSSSDEQDESPVTTSNVVRPDTTAIRFTPVHASTGEVAALDVGAEVSQSVSVIPSDFFDTGAGAPNMTSDEPISNDDDLLAEFNAEIAGIEVVSADLPEMEDAGAFFTEEADDLDAARKLEIQETIAAGLARISKRPRLPSGDIESADDDHEDDWRAKSL